MTAANRPDTKTIRQGFLSVFDEGSAERWDRCVASLPLPEAPSDDDLGLALVIWATNLDDLAHVRAVLDTFTLQQVQVVGGGQSLLLPTAEALDSPVLRPFIQRTLTQALGKFVADAEHRASLGNLAVRDDDTGSAGADISYVQADLHITAYYGDPVRPARLINMRMVSGDALREIVAGGLPAPEAEAADKPDASEAFGVGATGPVLGEAA